MGTPQMSLTEVKEFMLDTVIPLNRTCIVRGGVGIGKTQTGFAAAKAANIPVIYMSFHGMLPEDAAGIPHLAVDPDNPNGAYVVQNSIPILLRNYTDRPALLLLDEIGSAQRELQPWIAQLIGERRSGPHDVPDYWTMYMTTNRVTDRSLAKGLPMNMINRAHLIDVRPDVEGFQLIAVQRGFHWQLLSWVAAEPDIVSTADQVPAEEEPFVTPRSLEAVSDMLRLHFGDETVHWDTKWMPRIASSIGDQAAARLAVYLQLGDQVPSYTSIIANPNTAKLPTGAAVIATIEMLLVKAKAQDIQQVCNYLLRLPEDFQIRFILRSLKSRTDLVGQKELIDLGKLYRETMNAVVGVTYGKTV